MLTNRLGTADSQLGSIVLGTVPILGATITSVSPLHSSSSAVGTR